MQRQRLGRRSDHGDADANVRLLARAERAKGQTLPVRLAENLETCVRQRVEHNADLHADWLILHERSEMLGFGACKRTALAAQCVRKIVLADQSVTEKALHFRCG